MSDLKKYIKKRKGNSKDFALYYDSGYHDFKLGVIIKQIREERGITQEELAKKIKTKKSAISRIENHAEDIKLSTLEKITNALDKELKIQIV
jgi:ribosome-binding protein aMBF1 (putative translation factor)